MKKKKNSCLSETIRGLHIAFRHYRMRTSHYGISSPQIKNNAMEKVIIIKENISRQCSYIGRYPSGLKINF